MSSSNSVWEWDANRNKYRYYNYVENRWVFDDEQKAAPASTNLIAQGTNYPSYSTGPTSSKFSSAHDAASLRYQGRTSSTYNENPYNASYQSYPRTTEPSRYPTQPSTRTRRQSQSSQLGSYTATGEPVSFRDTIISRPPGDLHRDFQIKRPGYDFFRTGVVFKVNWSEPAGDFQNDNSITTGQQFRGAVYTGIRWFVVIREGKDFSTCLRIQTFQRGGLTATKVKSQHAIIYTGNTVPNPAQWEQTPSFEGDRLGTPIRVIPNRPYDTLDPMSRINFVKLYTVEHNQRVYDFGRIDPDFEWILCTQFNRHWGIPGDRYPFSVALSQYSKNQSVIPESPEVSDISGRLSRLDFSTTSTASSDDGTETVGPDDSISQSGYGRTSRAGAQYGGTGSHYSTASAPLLPRGRLGESYASGSLSSHHYSGALPQSSYTASCPLANMTPNYSGVSQMTSSYSTGSQSTGLNNPAIEYPYTPYPSQDGTQDYTED